MKVVTAYEMKEIDRHTIEEIGIPSMVLMERAGLSVVRRIKDRFSIEHPVTVVAGGGNNGGDGLVIARELLRAGYGVKTFLLSPEDKLSPDCRAQIDILKKLNIKVNINKSPTAKDLKDSVVVDAIIGTGLNRTLRENLIDIVKLINSNAMYVFSVDIPTGISSDNAQIMGDAVMADETVTFGLPKIGHLLPPGAEYTGILHVEDIGFPPHLTDSDSLTLELVEEALVQDLITERASDTHKGDYGHVLVVGGSVGKTGASLMTARAALRSGAGLVTIALPEPAAEVLMGSVLEEMMLPLPSNLDGTIAENALDKILDFVHARADVLAIGPGLGRNLETWKMVRELVRVSPVPMVVDADGLNALSEIGYDGIKGLLGRMRSPVVLTPHIGEIVRLTGIKKDELLSNRLGVSAQFSVDTGAVLVLKGAPTLVSTPEGRQFINSTGNPGMATAGSGDVLTGIVASLIGQSLRPEEAAIAGVYIHGLSGDIASERLTEYSMTAGDLIRFLPEAFKRLS